MPCQGGVVDKDTVVANHTVMTHVHIGHQQIIVADSGFATILHGAAVDGHTFANSVVVTDHQARGFPPVLEIRGIFTDAGKLENPVVAP